REIKPMRTFLRDNGLTLVLSLMFAVCVAGMLFAGQATYNKQFADQGQSGLDLLGYVSSGEFLSALFENWESEFLQMAAYVVLTVRRQNIWRRSRRRLAECGPRLGFDVRRRAYGAASADVR
ncbi:DUF6766 family protein, partial [Xanthobacter sp. V0B-10]|uniref:DUF6766 family protein n=1 Tax=Xanthobacter albus TaxID=3119929 RepID=UPI0037262E9F